MSIKDKVILPFHEGFNFNAKFRENEVLAKISKFTVLLTICILMDSSFWFDTINLG